MDIDENAVMAIAALAERAKDGERFDLDGEQFLYANGRATLLIHEPIPDVIPVSTLQGLVDLLTDDQKLREEARLAIVHDVRMVAVYGPESTRTRRRPLLARCELPEDVSEFPFGRFVTQEEFVIAGYSLLIRDDGDFDTLMQYAGSVIVEESLQQDDNGTSQTAMTKSGIRSPERIEPAPKVVNLRPYRTFRGIEQPMGMFMFRMRQSPSEGVKFALFEADGGTWRLTAIESIQRFLTENLPGDDITIA